MFRRRRRRRETNSVIEFAKRWKRRERACVFRTRHKFHLITRVSGHRCSLLRQSLPLSRARSFSLLCVESSRRRIFLFRCPVFSTRVPPSVGSLSPTRIPSQHFFPLIPLSLHIIFPHSRYIFSPGPPSSRFSRAFSARDAAPSSLSPYSASFKPVFPRPLSISSARYR